MQYLRSVLESHHVRDGRASNTARQHLSLDDLNGFLAITRNVHFLSLWHSQPQPLDTIDCTFLSPPLHALTSCFLWLSRVSESQVQARQQEKKKKKTLFYFAHVQHLFMRVCHCAAGWYGCFSTVEARPHCTVWMCKDIRLYE